MFQSAVREPNFISFHPSDTSILIAGITAITINVSPCCSFSYSSPQSRFESTGQYHTKNINGQVWLNNRPRLIPASMHNTRSALGDPIDGLWHRENINGQVWLIVDGDTLKRIANLEVNDIENINGQAWLTTDQALMSSCQICHPKRISDLISLKSRHRKHQRSCGWQQTKAHTVLMATLLSVLAIQVDGQHIETSTVKAGILPRIKAYTDGDT